MLSSFHISSSGGLRGDRFNGQVAYPIYLQQGVKFFAASWILLLIWPELPCIVSLCLVAKAKGYKFWITITILRLRQASFSTLDRSTRSKNCQGLEWQTSGEQASWLSDSSDSYTKGIWWSWWYCSLYGFAWWSRASKYYCRQRSSYQWVNFQNVLLLSQLTDIQNHRLGFCKTCSLAVRSSFSKIHLLRAGYRDWRNCSTWYSEVCL